MRAITLAICCWMLAACASPGERNLNNGNAASKARAEAQREAREQERQCRLAAERGVEDPRCPAARPRSRHPSLPLETPGLPVSRLGDVGALLDR